MDIISEIKNEILNYTILKDIIEVEFDDYILEVELKYFKDLDISVGTLAEVIYRYYRGV